MANDDKIDDKIDEAREALGVGADSSTRTIQARFRKRAKDLQSGASVIPRSKKSFEELNEAYQLLMKSRQGGQKLATKHVTVLSSDVAGYSKMMAENEAETLEFFELCQSVFEEIVEKHQGRVFNTAGDAILAEFGYPFNGVECAVEIQRELRAINLGQPEGRKIQFRMGLNIGDCFLHGTDLLGDTVNIAARLQTAAKPGGICLSKALHDLICNKTPHTLTSLGDLSFKNIPEKVRTYALTEDDGTIKKHAADPKIASFEGQPSLAKKRAAAKAASSGPRTGLVFAALAFALGGAYLWTTRQAAPQAQAPAAAPVEPGHVFISTAPDAQVTVALNGKPVLQGGTPLLGDLKPGKYRVHLENKDLEFTEDDDLVVEAGKNVRLEKVLTAAKGAAAAGLAGSEAQGGTPLTPEETQQKQAADSGDAQAAALFGKKSAEKKNFADAYAYLKIAAKAHHPEASFELGKLFYYGQGVARDYDAAVYWLIVAADGGNREAPALLGQIQEKVPQDFTPAIVAQRDLSSVSPQHRQRDINVRDAFLQDLKETLRSKDLPF